MAAQPGQSPGEPGGRTNSDPPGSPAARSAASGGSGRVLGPDLSGTVLQDFQLLRRVGSGGMGEVYLAQQISLKRLVALKVLRPHLLSDSTALKRFAVEAEAAGKLTHANIVQIYALGEQQGTNFMALEYVQGMNLRDYVAKKGPVSTRFALKVMEQVAAALQHAADAGVVHRDIKPDNILLSRRGEVKVTDFGLARLRADTSVQLTQVGVTMGTPLYMSPEQVEGKVIDSRSDLYSFGVTCYYMLAGTPPYRGETALAIAVQHLKGQPAPLAELRPDIPPGLCRIVHRLMEKIPDQRIQTARQVLRELEKLRGTWKPGSESEGEGRAVEAQPATAVGSVSPRQSRWLRAFQPEVIRNNLAWWFAASLILALGSSASFGWYLRAPRVRPPRQSASLPDAQEISWQQVPQQRKASEQYEYALAVGQFNDPEAAWAAVYGYFPTESDWAWKAKLQLGRHYMDEQEYEKAARHFEAMIADPHRMTQLAGTVGSGVLLSLQAQPQESLDILWSVAQTGELASERILIGLVLWGFERNYRNLGTDWAPDVRSWAARQIERFRPRTGPRNAGDRSGPGARSPDNQRKGD